MTAEITREVILTIMPFLLRVNRQCIECFGHSIVKCKANDSLKYTSIIDLIRFKPDSIETQLYN